MGTTHLISTLLSDRNSGPILLSQVVRASIYCMQLAAVFCPISWLCGSWEKMCQPYFPSLLIIHLCPFFIFPDNSGYLSSVLPLSSSRSANFMCHSNWSVKHNKTSSSSYSKNIYVFPWKSFVWPGSLLTDWLPSSRITAICSDCYRLTYESWREGLKKPFYIAIGLQRAFLLILDISETTELRKSYK